MGTEIFKAASGREVKPGEDGSLTIGKVIGYLSREAAYDAEEYFQWKRDAELGRWRWPANPDWVAIEGDRDRDGRTVVVVNERTLDRSWFNERVRDTPSDADAAHQAGRAYFEAHPERKPWEDAEAGEVWVLTVDGHEAHFVADGKEFNGTNEFGRFICCSHDDEDITAGRRVWPEVTS